MWTKPLPIVKFSIKNPPDQATMEYLRAESSKKSTLWLYAQGAVTLLGIAVAVLFLANVHNTTLLTKFAVLLGIGLFFVPLMVICDERSALWGTRAKELSPANLSNEELSELLVNKPPKTTSYIQAVYNQQRELTVAEYVMLSVLAKSEREG